MKKEIKILFIHSGLKSFVKKDLDILQNSFNTIELHNYRKSGRNFFKIIRHTLWSDIVFCWFGSRHAFLPVLISKLFGKKSVVVAGGWDVANVPDIDYGMMRGGFSKIIGKFILHNVTKISSVSGFNQKEVIENAEIAVHNIRMIYLGFKAPDEKILTKKEDMVITVGDVEQSTLKRKGLESFVRSAANVPGASFVLIGKYLDNSIDYLKSIAPDNVKFTGPISDEELENYFKKAKIYLQLSRHEAFGCALAEAMLYQCIPVVTNNGALPEVVGNCGYYVNQNDQKSITNALLSAMKDNDNLGPKARDRIINEFPLKKRERELIKLIEEIASLEETD